jgi:hypothetical protein
LVCEQRRADNEVVLLGVAYAVLVLTSMLPWKRWRARLVVPGTVLAVCTALIIAAQGETAVVFYLSLPVLVALSRLGLATLQRGERTAP